MSELPFESPTEDSVAKTDGSIAVGEDYEFQKKWWRFERIAWIVLVCVLVADVLGGFGRGWLAHAQKKTLDGAMTLKYDRIARASTPSVMTFEFNSKAVHQGRIRLYLSNSVVKSLGAMRIAPEPAQSSIGDGGVTYDFPATEGSAMVQVALEPQIPGSYSFRVDADGEPPILGSVFVMP